jgi:hypothetical protein
MRRAILKGAVRLVAVLFTLAALCAFLVSVGGSVGGANIVLLTMPAAAVLGILAVLFWRFDARLKGQEMFEFPRGTMLGEVAEALRRLWALRRRPSGNG